jgi:hypothetical protein
MKNACAQWNDQLLEDALGGAPGSELRAHLARCAECAAKLDILRARNQRLESFLPQLARAAEPSPDLRARILAVAENSATRRPTSLWRMWVPIAAASVLVIALATALGWKRQAGPSAAELRGAQALAEWRAPSDIFLQLPKQDFLNTVPRLGESYMEMQIKSQTGGKK